MYGVGYTNSAASFLNSTDLGTTPVGWGMYIAADGNARLFFNAGSGISYQFGVSYASNFTLNSDRRRKTKIKDYEVVEDKIRWRTFELKSEPGQYRVGVIAQELLETKYSKFVNQEDPENYTINNIDLLNAKMAEKDMEIEELTTRIERLEIIIKAIEQLQIRLGTGITSLSYPLDQVIHQIALNAAMNFQRNEKPVDEMSQIQEGRYVEKIRRTIERIYASNINTIQELKLLMITALALSTYDYSTISGATSPQALGFFEAEMFTIIENMSMINNDEKTAYDAL